MKAMVFAAGLGTRLKPETDNKPKALVEINGKPMLQHVIENLKLAGVDYAVVNVHHFARQIEEFLKRNNNFGIEIEISDETDLLLDTGGGLIKAASMLYDKQPVLLHNADILTDVNLAELFSFHVKYNCDVTLLTDSHRNSSRCLMFNADNIMRGWTNTATGHKRPFNLNTENLHCSCFNGIHVVSQQTIKRLRNYRPAGVPFSITNFYIDTCNCSTITSYQIPKVNQWFDIGSPEKLAKARATFVETRKSF